MAAEWMKLSLIIVFIVFGNCTRFRDWRLDYGVSINLLCFDSVYMTKLTSLAQV